MDPSLCLSDEQLLPVATGEATAPPVQEHLEGCHACQGRLRRLRAEVATLRETRHSAAGTLGWLRSIDLPSISESPGQETEVPASIGRYRVIGLLDSGGQATVYRAAHPSLSRELVIKLSHRPVGPDGPSATGLWPKARSSRNWTIPILPVCTTSTSTKTVRSW